MESGGFFIYRIAFFIILLIAKISYIAANPTSPYTTLERVDSCPQTNSTRFQFNATSPQFKPPTITKIYAIHSSVVNFIFFELN